MDKLSINTSLHNFVIY